MTPAAPGRLLVIGASSATTCGVRDLGRALGSALVSSGTQVENLWWERDSNWTTLQTRRSAARFGARVEEALRRDEHAAVLWHYSVFEYGLRTAWDLAGMPVHALPLARRLGQGRRPVVVWLHECAYAFTERGWERKALAAGQRLTLRAVVGAAAGAIVTSTARERWLRTRRWLPARPVARIPACATVSPRPGSSPASGSFRLGVLGFGADDARADVVTGAVAALRRRGHDVQLELLGAPGPDGTRADRWRRAAHASGCDSAVSFSGVLPEADFAARLGAVDAMALPHAAGPVPGKTTLASALAFAMPVVALDGPERWDLLASERAVALAAPDPAGLAAELETLLIDPTQRAHLAETGHAFFTRELSPQIAAQRVTSFIAEHVRGAT
jgi:glycosyltransferase involved in cell wall biosynthesis